MPSENVEEDFHCHFFPLSSSLHCLLLIFFSGGGLRSASFILADNLISDLIIRPPFHWTLLRAAVFAGSDGRGGGPSAVFEPLQSLNPLRLSGCILAAYQCLHLFDRGPLAVNHCPVLDGRCIWRGDVEQGDRARGAGFCIAFVDVWLTDFCMAQLWSFCFCCLFDLCHTNPLVIQSYHLSCTLQGL